MRGRELACWRTVTKNKSNKETLPKESNQQTLEIYLVFLSDGNAVCSSSARFDLVAIFYSKTRPNKNLSTLMLRIK